MNDKSAESYVLAKIQLDKLYTSVKRLLMPYQSATTGLFSCTDEAYVRDSVYCAAALWSLGLAYRRINDDKGRQFELEHCTVKCMRGVLTCYMRQSSKLEKFKSSQSRENALHCKFNAWTGDAITDYYPHLQQDVVALFILYLVQMVSSGLQIVYSTDEVAFIQNLIYYLERSYRVPDYGMWGRGSKYNNDNREVHASAIGAAKAALESANGFNLFGKRHGAPWSVLWVDMDAHGRNRSVVNTLLPKESVSKNTDAALMPSICYPFFSIDDDDLCEETLMKLKSQLEGKYGYRRFLGDGYRTVFEDRKRQYYRPAEIKLFHGIECEWPVFFIYDIINAVYLESWDKVRHYEDKLQAVLWKSDNGELLVPRFYYVAAGDASKEVNEPGSAERLCSFINEDENPVFLYGQALYVISQLLANKLLSCQELDPIRRYVPPNQQHGVSMRYSAFQGVTGETTIQVVLIAESVTLQAQLSTYGISTQTPDQVEPVQIWPSQKLVKVYEHLGVLSSLGLSGRPNRPIGSLGTSKVYRILGNTVVCYPLLFDIGDFYMAFDTQILLDEIKHTLKFINKYWQMPERPIFITVLREDVMKLGRLGPIMEMLSAFKRGEWEGVKVRVGKIQSFIGSTIIEHLEFVRYGDRDLHEAFFEPFLGTSEEIGHKTLRRATTSCGNIHEVGDPELELESARNYNDKSTDEVVRALRNYRSPEALTHLLSILIQREGEYFNLKGESCQRYANRIYRVAAHQKKWDLVRRMACICKKTVDSLAPSISSILVKGREVTLGVFNHEEFVVSNPLAPSEIKDILYSICSKYNDYEACLQQELVLHVAAAMSDHAELFEGMLRVRIGWLIHAMKLHLGGDSKVYSLSPSGIKELVLDVLTLSKKECTVSWLKRRQINGALNKVPHGFYQKVWTILQCSSEGLVINGHKLPQQPTISDMSPLEIAWFKLVEGKLTSIQEPVYRHIVVETLVVIGTILEKDSNLEFDFCVDVDWIIKMASTMHVKEMNYGNEKSDLERFYDLDRLTMSKYVCRSVVSSLLQCKVNLEPDKQCVLS